MKGVQLSPAMRRALVWCADEPVRLPMGHRAGPSFLALQRRELVEWSYAHTRDVWTITADGLELLGRAPREPATEIF